MKLPVNKLSVTQLSVLRFQVFLTLFIAMAIAAGAQDAKSATDAPAPPDEALIDAPASFDADSFFGSSDPGGSVASGSGQESGNDPAAAGGTGTASASVYIPSSRQVSGLVFTGEATTDLLYSISEPFDSFARSGSYNGVSSLRFDAIGGDRNEAKIEASVIVRMIYGDAALLLVSSGPLMTVDLKKLYLSVYMPMADISIGRMIVNYGRGTVFSPVDLFSGVDTADISLGRTGNDALRVLFPFGNFSGLDLVATIASSPEQSIAGGRFFGHAAGWDFGLSAFRDGRNSTGGNSTGGDSTGGDGDLVVGLDLKGDIEFGVSAEALARIPFDASSPDLSEAVYSLMAGLDYSIKGQWFFDLEYLWNIRSGQAYPVGGFRHEHNLFASLSWKPDDLTALDVRAIVVPAETLGQVTLGASRSIARGASLMGFAAFNHGNVKGTPTSGSALNSAPVDSDETNILLGARLTVAY